jgi:hypothetical protein
MEMVFCTARRARSRRALRKAHPRDSACACPERRQGHQRRTRRDLYLIIHLLPHALLRASGHDLYIDLPLAPWEAALGAEIEVPTLGRRGSSQGAGGDTQWSEITADQARPAQAARG